MESKRITLRIKRAEYETIKYAAARGGKSLNDYVNALIAEEVKAFEQKNGTIPNPDGGV